MKKYYIKVVCEYHLEIEAETEDEAIEIAESAECDGRYDLSDLEGFEYYIEDEEDI